jgi:hypothetical protein
MATDKAKYYTRILPSSRTVYGETLADLVSVYVPGYDTSDIVRDTSIKTSIDHHRYMLRSLSIRAVASEVQRELLQLRNLAADTPQNMSVLASSKISPIFGFLDKDGTSFVWDSPNRLILIEEDYQPYTGLQKPEGENIVWVSAETEESFLDSLAKLNRCEWHRIE